ncbi:hypothetical protein MNBD_GAMMA12-843 [hydrothermal vent metagenome]|uniref:Uncharacterized protein n=1 Tax=hydrothermal vent metagenome TaxID=652676 RepID=A0A3B0YI93_9ZZZZ
MAIVRQYKDACLFGSKAVWEEINGGLPQFDEYKY